MGQKRQRFRFDRSWKWIPCGRFATTGWRVTTSWMIQIEVTYDEDNGRKNQQQRCLLSHQQYYHYWISSKGEYTINEQLHERETNCVSSTTTTATRISISFCSISYFWVQLHSLSPIVDISHQWRSYSDHNNIATNTSISIATIPTYQITISSKSIPSQFNHRTIHVGSIAK